MQGRERLARACSKIISAKILERKTWVSQLAQRVCKARSLRTSPYPPVIYVLMKCAPASFWETTEPKRIQTTSDLAPICFATGHAYPGDLTHSHMRSVA